MAVTKNEIPLCSMCTKGLWEIKDLYALRTTHANSGLATLVPLWEYECHQHQDTLGRLRHAITRPEISTISHI
jgi:hypothetical protein